jgi:hypothetical protein
MKTLFLLFISILSLHVSFGQQKASAPTWKFNSILNVGLLNGETGSAFQLQTINGFKKASWFGGIGLGIDYYKIRSIPLFLDIRKDFGKTSNRLFLYGDAGINFGWATDIQKNIYASDDKMGNGFYTDLGLGYKCLINSSNNIVISLGYSYKKIEETYNSSYNIPIYYNMNGPNNVTTTSNQNQINYYLHRLSIKLGWEF